MPTHTVKLRTPGDIGLALAQSRIARGLTQQDLATQLDMPQSTVSEIESGKSTIFLRHLLEMARATGLNISAEWDTSGDQELNHASRR